MAPDRSRVSGYKGFFLLLVVGSLTAGMWQVVAQRQAAPNLEQQVAATLTSWGLSLDGIVSPVDAGEVEKRLAELGSPISEVRVQAADWLASHGVRSSGSDIAAAMDDPGTRRPCQLAKSLGELGDDRWADKLIAAARQQSNTDLRVCATIALGELQSPNAVDALIESYRNGAMSTFALDALSRIADPTTLDFFKQIASTSPSKREWMTAALAIERIELLRQPDPAGALIDRLKQQAAGGPLNEWTIRKLATLQDGRAVPTLREAFERTDQHEARVWLAAALLVHGDAGRVALSHLSQAVPTAGTSKSGPAIARAALNLTPRPGPHAPLVSASP